MNQVCVDCGHRYNDEGRTTVCPHSSVDHANTLCIVHDLHDCRMPIADGNGGLTECSTGAARIYQLLEPVLPSNGITPSHEARAWLHHSQPQLNMQIPRELIARGEIDRVTAAVIELRKFLPRPVTT